MKASRNWSGPRAQRYTEALDMLALLDAKERSLRAAGVPAQVRWDGVTDIEQARAYWSRIALRNAPRKAGRG